ncbi:MAG: ribosomal L7Ae/L30e/S12e/Gadd45 family protein [Clostridium sp.]|nr:ribosomal L7Ae/L30e/S12e/Gadd45 family protein [Clostridium sp.]
MDSRKRVLNYLGLARKAGKLSPGGFMTEKAVKGFRANLVLVSEEASGNTKKDFSSMCEYYKVPMYIFGDRDSLGRAIGRESCTSLAVTDAGFAGQIISLLETMQNGGSEYEGK